MPKCALQRLRARISSRKRRTLAGDRWRGLARQHAFEMLPRQPVLALEVEGAGEFEAHPHEAGALHQDGAQRGDRLVEQGVAAFLRPPRALRRAGCGEAREEQDVGAVRALGRLRREWAQQRQRRIVAAGLDERAGTVHLRVVGEVRTLQRPGAHARARQRQGEQEGGRRQRLQGPAHGRAPRGRPDRGRFYCFCAAKDPCSVAEPVPPLSALVSPSNQPAAPVGAAPDGPKNRPPQSAFAVKLPPEIVAASVVMLLKLNDGLRADKI